MPLSVFDRVREITSTTGSGSITLGGAITGFQSFDAVFNNGDQTYYTITNSNSWEVGLGTYSSGTVSRDQIFDSSNSGLPLFLSGTSYIFVTYPASKSVHKNTADEIPVGSAGLRFNDNTLQTTAAVAGSGGGVTYVGISASISGINVDTDSVSDSGTLALSGTISEVTEGAVTTHQAALSIAESQIVNGSILARVGSSETITGAWNFTGGISENGLQLSSLYAASGHTHTLNEIIDAGTRSYLNVSTDTVISTDYGVYFVDSSSNSVQLTLPLASGNGGKEFTIKRIAGSNPVVVAGSGSDQIDGQSSYNIDFIYQSTNIISNNTFWYKI